MARTNKKQRRETMKIKAFNYITILFIFLTINNIATAQENETQKTDTTYWSNAGTLGLNYGATQLNDWKAGGESSQSINLIFNKTFKYERDKHLWSTLVETSYGSQKLGSSDEFKKTDDLLHINTLYGYKIKKRWYLSYSFDLRTQWFTGEEIKDISGVSKLEKISSFMSPGFIVSGLSLTYKHNFGDKDFFIGSMFPVSNFKLTTISDKTIFKGYKNGESAFGVEYEKSTHFEWGLLTLTGQLQKALSKNTRLNSNITLFTPLEKAGDFDVNFDVIITSQVNKWLGFNLTYNLVYDDDVITDIQTKWILGIGMNVKL